MNSAIFDTNSVYLVALYTTGERWHTVVCATLRAVVNVLNAHGIDRAVVESMTGEYQNWVSSKDESQTATVSRVALVH